MRCSNERLRKGREALSVPLELRSGTSTIRMSHFGAGGGGGGGPRGVSAVSSHS